MNIVKQRRNNILDSSCSMSYRAIVSISFLAYHKDIVIIREWY